MEKCIPTPPARPAQQTLQASVRLWSFRGQRLQREVTRSACCPGLPIHMPLVRGPAASCLLIQPPTPSTSVCGQERGEDLEACTPHWLQEEPRWVTSVPLLASDISRLATHLPANKKSELSVFPGQQECFPTLSASALFLVRLSPTLLLPHSMNLALSLALCRPQVSSLANRTNNTTCQGCRDDILRGSGAWILE